jgi:hypothetical protein
MSRLYPAIFGAVKVLRCPASGRLSEAQAYPQGAKATKKMGQVSGKKTPGFFLGVFGSWW